MTQCHMCILHVYDQVRVLRDRLNLLDEMHSQNQNKHRKKNPEAKKIKQICSRLVRFNKKLESNSRETEELVMQTRLMLNLKSVKSSGNLALSIPQTVQASSIESLNRYISQEHSTIKEQSNQTTFSQDSLTLPKLTAQFNRLMKLLQHDKSLSDTHLREQLLQVASRIKIEKKKVLQKMSRKI